MKRTQPRPTPADVLAACDAIVREAPQSVGRVYAASAARVYADSGLDALTQQVAYILHVLKWNGPESKGPLRVLRAFRHGPAAAPYPTHGGAAAVRAWRRQRRAAARRRPDDHAARS